MKRRRKPRAHGPNDDVEIAEMCRRLGEYLAENGECGADELKDGLGLNHTRLMNVLNSADEFGVIVYQDSTKRFEIVYGLSEWSNW